MKVRLGGEDNSFRENPQKCYFFTNDFITYFKQIIGVKKSRFWCSGKHVLKTFLLLYNFVYVCILQEHFAAIV